ncbi:MAG TPA: lasso RiPP family leader peptide-containing protein [Planctomycetota bacterium]|nr:lasso RiPP family leader peptide-containing protein [Planctomycetota bacterium]
MTASPPPPSSPSPSPRTSKKAYQAPRVQVHGDVKTITGFGIQAGVNPFATSRHLFS